MSDPNVDDWNAHWGRYQETAELNPAQKWRHRLLLNMIGKDAQPGTILDIGSGQGDMAALLAQSWPSAKLLGLDLSETGCRIAKAKVPAGTFIPCDLIAGAEPEDKHRDVAEFAICSEVLEHVDDPVTLLKNASKWMAPGCRLCITVPGGPMSAFDKHIGHRQHFTRQRIRAVLEEAGFVVERADGAGFPFFNLYRMVVVARGKKLIDDVEGDVAETSPLAKIMMQLFDDLFAFNLSRGSLGWQITALARKP